MKEEMEGGSLIKKLDMNLEETKVAGQASRQIKTKTYRERKCT